jgi:hypothetical protein
MTHLGSAPRDFDRQLWLDPQATRVELRPLHAAVRSGLVDARRCRDLRGQQGTKQLCG